MRDKYRTGAARERCCGSAMASSSSLRCETTTGLDGGCATGSAALRRGGFVRRVEMTFGLSAFDSSLDMRLGHQQAGNERNTFEMTDQKPADLSRPRAVACGRQHVLPWTRRVTLPSVRLRLHLHHNPSSNSTCNPTLNKCWRRPAGVLREKPLCPTSTSFSNPSIALHSDNARSGETIHISSLALLKVGSLLDGAPCFLIRGDRC